MQFSLKDILKENQLLSEGRKEDARKKYPDIPQGVFETFVNMDPSGNHKYLMWIMSKWEEEYGGWSYRYNNQVNARNLMENIQYFHKQTQKFEKKDINQYEDLDEFIRVVSEAKKTLTKGEIKKSAKKIYESGNHLVVVPLTHAASCYYGAGTQWCTTMRNNPNYYMNYTQNGTLFYYINKSTGKKRAFYTKFTHPFLRPETVSGGEHRELGSTEVYTETDARGRSLRGIPIAARQAMNSEHDKLFKKYLASIPEKDRIQLLINNGMPLPEGYTTHEGDWKYSIHTIPSQITKIVGSVSSYGLRNFNNVKEVTGNVDIDVNSINWGALQVIGGNLSHVRRWGYYSSVDNIGKIKKIGGTFKWHHFGNVSKEALSGLKEVGKIEANKEQVSTLATDVRIPGLPNTNVRID